eukprot:TRINITY_DN2682_c2_g1_i1.p1 TRINITY_DN2682_c2_g1~~TRINITY_DN2682_c2_g1_i1.p1  ORF type:complete len:355 (-),score=74.93 TRINITY_DN2682_c2_g1_i1:183-1247(-)
MSEPRESNGSKPKPKTKIVLRHRSRGTTGHTLAEAISTMSISAPVPLSLEEVCEATERVDVHMKKCTCKARRESEHPFIELKRPALQDGKEWRKNIYEFHPDHDKNRVKMLSRCCVLEEPDCANGFMLFSGKRDILIKLMDTEITKSWENVPEDKAHSDLANVLCIFPTNAVALASEKSKVLDDLVYRNRGSNRHDEAIEAAKREVASAVADMFTSHHCFSKYSRGLTIPLESIWKNATLDGQVGNCWKQFKEWNVKEKLNAEIEEETFHLLVGWEKDEDGETFVNFGIPGGKRLIHENSWDCAVRECEEETGFKMFAKEIEFESPSLSLKVNPDRSFTPYSMNVFAVEVCDIE